MARALKVKRLDAGPNVNYLYFSVYRLRLEIEEAVEMDDRVFLFQRLPTNPHTGDTLDVFVTVCSPVDMSDYPPEEPDPVRQYPFFRRNAVELDFRATQTAEDAYTLIVAELGVLCRALDRMDELQTESSVWVGAGEPDGGSSESMEA